MDPQVFGIDHLYVTVSDLTVSERFYDPVMRALGLKKGTAPIAGEPHVHYIGRTLQYSIRPARSGAQADPYRTGALHHVCFRVENPTAVDEAHRRLRALGVEATEPRLYPEYRPDYYATFFADPDGIRLELVADSARRRLIRERWDELTDFEDPVARLLERDAQRPDEARKVQRGNLFDEAAPSSGESMDVLAKLRATTIERIVSSSTPALEPYDQTQDEWVMLVSGSARLEVDGQTLELSAGDYVLLPAHTPHRVLATSHGARWLAVHVAGNG